MNADNVSIGFAELEELAAKAENFERLKRLLRRYVAEHAGRYSPPGCNCAWCTEAEAFLLDE